jgi:hypothetical protein
MANLGTITRGDTEVIELTVKNPNNSPRDITTDSIKFTLKKSKYDAVPILQKTVGAGIVKTDTASGLAEVTIDPPDLVGLAREQTLHCDVEITDAVGRVATTLHTVNFILDVST